MRKKGFKGRCDKRTLTKCKEVCRTYDPIQYVYADKLQENVDIKEIRCNVPLEGLTEGDYMSDFVCMQVNTEAANTILDCNGLHRPIYGCASKRRQIKQPPDEGGRQ